jgi:2,3-bisphosphoglycerate-dependent phosphoglycerate mutase
MGLIEGLVDKVFAKKPKSVGAGRVGIRTGSVITEVGASAILHALFSTISKNLETEGWGTRFPMVLGPLYQGHLNPDQCGVALSELRIIYDELCKLPIERVVWDIEQPMKHPHSAYRSNPLAKNVAEYFLTVNSLDLLKGGLIDSLESAVEFGHSVKIIAFNGPEDFFEKST